ncbi:MAG TPA: hypothetical protein VFU33_09815 [Gaiellaceae bacterium]|nr:hypothetical protein [Gaiellaceae bacterium]
MSTGFHALVPPQSVADRGQLVVDLRHVCAVQRRLELDIAHAVLPTADSFGLQLALQLCIHCR